LYAKGKLNKKHIMNNIRSLLNPFPSDNVKPNMGDAIDIVINAAMAIPNEAKNIFIILIAYFSVSLWVTSKPNG